jgi:hypothetical protein
MVNFCPIAAVVVGLLVISNYIHGTIHVVGLVLGP